MHSIRSWPYAMWPVAAYRAAARLLGIPLGGGQQIFLSLSPTPHGSEIPGSLPCDSDDVKAVDGPATTDLIGATSALSGA